MAVPPPLSYIILEILGVFFLIICGYFRIKKADMNITRVIMELLGILLFGLLLEILAVSIGLYNYPPASFVMMIFNVPIIIGIGWSVILFSSMLFYFSDFFASFLFKTAQCRPSGEAIVMKQELQEIQ